MIGYGGGAGFFFFWPIKKQRKAKPWLMKTAQVHYEEKMVFCLLTTKFNFSIDPLNLLFCFILSFRKLTLPNTFAQHCNLFCLLGEFNLCRVLFAYFKETNHKAKLNTIWVNCQLKPRSYGGKLLHCYWFSFQYIVERFIFFFNQWYTNMLNSLFSRVYIFFQSPALFSQNYWCSGIFDYLKPENIPKTGSWGWPRLIEGLLWLR